MDGPSSSKISEPSEGVSPYNDTQLRRAAQSLSKELESGSLRFLKLRNVVHCENGPGWDCVNLWEGDEGFMDHVTRAFPLPPRATAHEVEEVVEVEDEDDDDVVEIKVSPGTSASNNRKKTKKGCPQSSGAKSNNKEDAILIADSPEKSDFTETKSARRKRRRKNMMQRLSENLGEAKKPRLSKEDGSDVVRDVSVVSTGGSIGSEEDEEATIAPLFLNHSTGTENNEYSAEHDTPAKKQSTFTESDDSESKAMSILQNNANNKSSSSHSSSSDDSVNGNGSEEGEIVEKSDNYNLNNNSSVKGTSAQREKRTTDANSNSNSLSHLESQINKIKLNLNKLSQRFWQKSKNDNGLSAICKKMCRYCVEIEQFSVRLDQEKDSFHSSSKQGSDQHNSKNNAIQSLERNLEVVFSQYEKIRIVRGELVNRYNSQAKDPLLIVKSPQIKKWVMNRQGQAS